MGGERQWTGVGGVGQLGAVSWPFGVGVGQVGGASSSQFGMICGRHAGDVVGAPQIGREHQWTGVGGIGQLGAVSWPFGVCAGQVGRASSVQYGQIGGRHAGGVGGDGQLDGVPSWNRGGERQQSGVGGVGQMGWASWPVGQMGGTTSSSQFGQMGGEEWRGAGVGGTLQGVVGAAQIGVECEWNGVGGVGQLGGVPLPIGVGAGQMGGIMGSSQFGVGQMGAIMSSSQAGVGA